METITYMAIDSTGWLCPNGILYKCKGQEHYSSAQDICEELGISKPNMPDDRYLEERGWIKIQRGVPLLGDVNPNEIQRSVVMNCYFDNTDFYQKSQDQFIILRSFFVDADEWRDIFKSIGKG